MAFPRSSPLCGALCVKGHTCLLTSCWPHRGPNMLIPVFTRASIRLSIITPNKSAKGNKSAQKSEILLYLFLNTPSYRLFNLQMVNKSTIFLYLSINLLNLSINTLDYRRLNGQLYTSCSIVRFVTSKIISEVSATTYKISEVLVK